MSLEPPPPLIFGCQGLTLSPEEKDFFKKVNPLGFIFFARNIQDEHQIQSLIGDLKHTVGRENVVFLIDEEGGRVSRLRQLPEWTVTPSAKELGKITDLSEAYATCFSTYQKIGKKLYTLGFNVNCAPVLDLFVPGAHKVIGDRSFGEEPERISTLGKGAVEGLLSGNVIPVIKHLPGHGAALVDSHEELPILSLPLKELRPHFEPFKNLSKGENNAFWGMVNHLLYGVLDAVFPASLSPSIIENVIRREIGFKGFLISDDLCMKAVKGTPQEKVSQALKAGCDAVIYGQGDLKEMEEAVEGAFPLKEISCQRLEKSFNFIHKKFFS